MCETKQPKIYHIDAGYKMVDTCAGSFAANSAGEFNEETPYFYPAYAHCEMLSNVENEAEAFLRERSGGAMAIPLSFRFATEADADEICALVRAAVAEMAAHGIDQWDAVYPSREDILRDIQHHTLRVGETTQGGRTRICAIYTLNQESDAEYDCAQWHSDGAYLVLHRLCVHPDVQHRGVGAKTLCHAEEEARAEGAESIRLDVFSKNPFSLRLYEHAGYEKTGEAQWRKGRFFLMEKDL